MFDYIKNRKIPPICYVVTIDSLNRAEISKTQTNCKVNILGRGKSDHDRQGRR